MGKFQDLTGQRFGRLTVISCQGKNKKGRYLWLCQCECGKQKIITSNGLKHQNIKSCGCLKVISNEKHGDYKTRLYRIFYGMRFRCYNPNSPDYKYYGGKGIKICKEWENNYANFRDWAINNGYKEGLSIDRIDNNKNYSPNNCRWRTLQEQARNTSRIKHIEYKGKKYCMSELARMFNIEKNTFYGRIKRGWDIEKAIIPPIKSTKL